MANWIPQDASTWNKLKDTLANDDLTYDSFKQNLLKLSPDSNNKPDDFDIILRMAFAYWKHNIDEINKNGFLDDNRQAVI